MATMKAKNGDGEWVDIGLAGLMGDLKMETVGYGYGEHKQSLDLSPYVGANDNFIIILELSQYQNDSTTNYFLWHKADGLDNLLSFKTSPSSTSLTNGIFRPIAGSNITVTYDENTQIFTLDDDTYKWIYSFTILYAGIKEA